MKSGIEQFLNIPKEFLFTFISFVVVCLFVQREVSERSILFRDIASNPNFLVTVFYDCLRE